MHAILHIGSEKTGTTSIQRLFATNRQGLSAQGVLYPVTGATPWGHHGIAAHVCDPSADITLASIDAPTDLADALHQEAQDAGCPTVVISSELLGSRLRTADDVARVRDLIEQFARKITVVLYARNPVAMAESQFAMTVTAGNTAPFPHDAPGALPPEHRWPLDAHSIASLWADVFGRDNVCVRPYHRASLSHGSAIDDFATLCGLDPETDLPPEHQRHHGNPSHSRDALAFLRAVHLMPAAERPSPEAILKLKQAMVTFRGGGTFRLPLQTAQALLQQLRPSYEALVREFLEGEPFDLLDCPSVARPDALDTLELTTTVAVRAALHLAKVAQAGPGPI